MGNKNDAADAQAIWLAVQQPSLKAIAVKTEEQQAVLALHRMRQQLVKFRMMQCNCLRGLLAEYGEVMANGRAALDRSMKEILELISQMPVWPIFGQTEVRNGEPAISYR
jgi:transposase